MWQRCPMRRRAVCLLAFTAMLAAACSDEPPATGSTAVTERTDGAAGSTEAAGTEVATPDEATPDDTLPEDAILDISLACDPLDERACLLPWPNDAFTVPDASTDTGRRLDIHPASAPANATGTPIDVTDQNRADGFSPGSAVLALVPGLDVQATGIAPSTDIGSSLAPDAPIVLLDTTTGRRVPYWGELDAGTRRRPTVDDPPGDEPRRRPSPGGGPARDEGFQRRRHRTHDGVPGGDRRHTGATRAGEGLPRDAGNAG